MDPFLEDFDNEELWTFFFGNEKKPEYICSRCKEKIVSGGWDLPPRITITNRSNEALHMHEACFEELFRVIKTGA